MKKFLLLAPFAIFGISSCSDHDKPCPTPTDFQSIVFSPAIADIQPVESPGTKTAISGSTAAWANNDVIGLFCEQSIPAGVNVQYTVSGLPSSPVWAASTPIYWKDGTTSHKFLAYAPYASGNTDPTLVKLPAISTQTGTINPAHDFLISNNQYGSGVARTIGDVPLTFTHALSLIEFKMLIGGGVSAGTTLTSFTLAGASGEKIYSSDNTSTIALSSGVITPGTTTNTATITPATPPTLTTTAASYYAIILPGTYSGPTLTVSIKDGGSTAITTTTVPVVTTAFVAGNKYSYVVTIGRTAITISNPTITDWTTTTGSPINPGI